MYREGLDVVRTRDLAERRCLGQDFKMLVRDELLVALKVKMKSSRSWPTGAVGMIVRKAFGRVVVSQAAGGSRRWSSRS